MTNESYVLVRSVLDCCSGQLQTSRVVEEWRKATAEVYVSQHPCKSTTRKTFA